MSDVIFRPALTAPNGIPGLTHLRTGTRRLRRVASSVAEAVHTYSLIEGATLIAAMVFCSVFAAAAFGIAF